MLWRHIRLILYCDLFLSFLFLFLCFFYSFLYPLSEPSTPINNARPLTDQKLFLSLWAWSMAIWLHPHLLLMFSNVHKAPPPEPDPLCSTRLIMQKKEKRNRKSPMNLEFRLRTVSRWRQINMAAHSINDKQQKFVLLHLHLFTSD